MFASIDEPLRYARCRYAARFERRMPHHLLSARFDYDDVIILRATRLCHAINI